MREPVDDFLVAATVPLDASHASGTLRAARQLLEQHPEVAGANIYAASVLGDDTLVRSYIAHQRSLAIHKGGPHGWDALTYLCFSRFLQHDKSSSEGFVRAAEALIAAGASANTGFMTVGHRRQPEWECVLYGACGVSHNAPLTSLLLEHGADANDGEVTYHAPETYDNAALQVLVEHGTLTADSLATLLLRKADWHDEEGIAYLLAAGANPDHATHWGRSPLMQAIARDNDVSIIQRMLDAGGTPNTRIGSHSAVAEAARGGRRDVLELFMERGIDLTLYGADQLMAWCALNSSKNVRKHVTAHPADVAFLLAHGGELMAKFTGIGNAKGVRQLLVLGIPVDARDAGGNGYWGIAKESTALHVAAWRLRPAMVRILLTSGADPNARDGNGQTPLMLAVKACVDSYWKDRRTPACVRTLLNAGARTDGVQYPCGYPAVDRLVAAHVIAH